jgi:hypothetical protein
MSFGFLTTQTVAAYPCIPLALKEGDHILFGKYSESEIQIDGNGFLIMKEEEVHERRKPSRRLLATRAQSRSMCCKANVR